MTSSADVQQRSVLLDANVLSRLALIGKTSLLTVVLPDRCTTAPAIRHEIEAGIDAEVACLQPTHTVGRVGPVDLDTATYSICGFDTLSLRLPGPCELAQNLNRDIMGSIVCRCWPSTCPPPPRPTPCSRASSQPAASRSTRRDEPWGMHSSMVADPDGNLIEIGSWNKGA